MRNLLAGAFVFSGGFAIMVLEVVGARYLIKDFGSSFYVWTSQIGVILMALAAGYAVGGTLGDRFQKASFLAWLLVPTGVFIALIPAFSPAVINWIIMRHPLDAPIPEIWQKIDPVIGSLLIFGLPCFVLAMLSPYTIRLTSHHLHHVGRISGFIYAASTVGSIAGVFVSGYILIGSSFWPIPRIFYVTGAVTILLGVFCLFMDRWLVPKEIFNATQH